MGLTSMQVLHSSLAGTMTSKVARSELRRSGSLNRISTPRVTVPRRYKEVTMAGRPLA